MKGRRLTAFTLTLPWLATLVIFWAFPIIYSLVLGFTDFRLVAPDSAQYVGWDNYTKLLSDPAFLAAVKNTFIFVLGTIPITTIISLGLALLVNRQFRFRGLFRAGFFMPSITSMVVIALIFVNLYERGGYLAALAQMIGLSTPEYGLLLDDSTALPAIMAMDIWMSVGYFMLIFLAGLKSIPDELYESADLMGASWWQRLTSITLPMLRPVALYIIVINSIKSFQVFIEILVMTSGKFDTATMVYFIYDVGLTSGFEAGYASAAAYLLFTVIAIFSALLFLVTGRRKPLW